MIEVREARPGAELEEALALRERVFVEEQGVPMADERDGRDTESIHLVAVDGGRVLATCRLLPDGPRLLLGRMAVEPDARRSGLATRLLDEAERVARATGARCIALHAQTGVVSLYEAAGYERAGAPFMEAEIEHVTMERDVA